MTKIRPTHAVRAHAIAALAFASALSFGPTWTENGELSLASEASARSRVYIRTGYLTNAGYYAAEGLPWYAVRAYYYGGPWSGAGFGYTGWADYAAQNGIGCTPGTPSKAATASCMPASRNVHLLARP